MAGTLPRWDFRRSAAAAREMANVGVEHGLPLPALLANSGLTPDALGEGAKDIEASQELAVARNLARLLDDPPGLGTEVATRFNLNSFGLLGFALVSSPTLRDAARVGMRYLDLGHAFTTITFTTTPATARLTFDARAVPDDVRNFLLERDMAVVLGIVLPAFFGDTVTSRLDEAHLDIELGEARAGWLAAVVPTTNISFRRPGTVLSFPADFLDAPTPLPNADVARTCEEQCRALLQQRRQRTGLAAQVRGRLLQDPGNLPSADELAAELHIDRRTLHRRLAQEDTSFRQLREEVRRTLAIEMLSVLGLTVSETAQRLGYASSPAFSHSFTRWTGQPPGSYRRNPPA